MIVFCDGRGAIISSTPERYFQGEALGGTVYLVAPFSMRNTVTLGFILPDGRYTHREGMTPVNDLPGVTDKIGDKYSIWSWPTNNKEVTELAGRVTVQFFITYNGNTVATASTSFLVEPGVNPLPPDPADPDAWDQILALIADNARRIALLESRITAKVLTDFTVNAETGKGVKYYSDGSTAEVQFPTGGGEPPVESGFLKLLTFTAESWIPSDEGGYELAFGPAQTGYTHGKFIVMLSRNGTETYKAGNDLMPVSRNGFYSMADTVFTGSDGSLFLTANETYGGRLLMFDAAVFSGNFVKNIAIVEGDLFVTYADGTTERMTASWTTPEEVDAKIRAALTWQNYT